MLAVAVMAAGAQVALGQYGQYGYNPYVPPVTEPGVRWTACVLSLVFVAAISIVAFKNSRRTHLD